MLSSGFWRGCSFRAAYVESVRLHAAELKQYLPRWWRDGVTTCRQSPVTLTSPDGLNLHTCHHFAPSRWRYRRYLHSPGELEMTQNATVLRNRQEGACGGLSSSAKWRTWFFGFRAFVSGSAQRRFYVSISMWGPCSRRVYHQHFYAVCCSLTRLKTKENYQKKPIKGVPPDLLALVWAEVLSKRAELGPSWIRLKATRQWQIHF